MCPISRRGNSQVFTPRRWHSVKSTVRVQTDHSDPPGPGALGRQRCFGAHTWDLALPMQAAGCVPVPWLTESSQEVLWEAPRGSPCVTHLVRDTLSVAELCHKVLTVAAKHIIWHLLVNPALSTLDDLLHRERSAGAVILVVDTPFIIFHHLLQELLLHLGLSGEYRCRADRQGWSSFIWGRQEGGKAGRHTLSGPFRIPDGFLTASGKIIYTLKVHMEQPMEGDRAPGASQHLLCTLTG